MFCPNCGKQNDVQGKYCTFCGNQLKFIDKQKEVYSDLQNRYKDKIIEQLLDSYFQNNNIENNVFYKRAELYDMTNEQVDRIILTFQENITKVNAFIEKLYENKLTFSLTDEEVEEFEEYLEALDFEHFEYKDDRYDQQCNVFLEKYNKDHEINKKREYIESLIEKYDEGEESLAFSPIKSIDENDLKELYECFHEAIFKYEGEIKRYCNNEVDFMYDVSMMDELTEIGIKLGFSKEDCTKIMFAYRDRSGVSELDKLKQITEMRKQLCEVLKLYQLKLYKKQKFVLNRIKRILPEKSCVLLGEPLVFESKCFVKHYIHDYVEKHIKSCAIEQDKVNQIDVASDSVLYTIAKMLESFMNNSYNAIHRLENQLGLKKDKNFYDAIDNYVSIKIEELSTAQEVFSKIDQGVDVEAEYRRLRKASRGRWQGGGFGVGGAIKGAAQAGMMNMGTGAIHSVVNGLGNIKSEIKASRKKSKIVRSILDGIPEKTDELLSQIDGLMIRKMESEYPDCIVKDNTNVERQLRKQFHDNPNSIKLILALLQENPLNVNHYLSALKIITSIENQKDYNNNIQTLLKMAKWFDVDLRIEVRNLLEKDINQMEITKEIVEDTFRTANSVCKNSIAHLEKTFSIRFLQIIKKASVENDNDKVVQIETILQEMKMESLYHAVQETIRQDIVQTLKSIMDPVKENEELQKQGIFLKEITIRELYFEKVFLPQNIQKKIEDIVKTQLQYKAYEFIKLMNVESPDSVKEACDRIKAMYVRNHTPVELELLNSCLEEYISNKLEVAKCGSDILSIKEYALAIKGVLLNASEQIRNIDEKYNSFKIVYDYETDYIEGMEGKSSLYYASIGKEYGTVEEADKVRELNEKIAEIYANCNVHNEENLREALAQIEDIYAQCKYGSEIIKELKCRLEQLDLLARTVLDVVYDTREEALKESRKVVGNKKFDTEEAAEAERDRLRRERELIDFENKEISKLKEKEKDEKLSAVEFLKLIKIKKFQTIEGKQYEENFEKKILNYYNSTKNNIEKDIKKTKTRRNKLKVIAVIAALIGLKLFFAVGLILKIIILVVVLVLFGEVLMATEELEEYDKKKHFLQDVEKTFIIQNEKMYLRKIKVRVIEKYNDKTLGKLVDPGEIIEVLPDRLEQLLESKVVEKI